MGSNGAEWGSLFGLNGGVCWEGGGDQGSHFSLDGGVVTEISFTSVVHSMSLDDNIHCSTDCFFIDTYFSLFPFNNI